MITLLAVLIIGFILTYTYIVMNRREIEQKQEASQRENEIFLKLLEEADRQTREERVNRDYEPEI